ncbi:MAG: threonine synthase [Nitrospinae bacterium]|nr:threonine synthase [Nitrospinota bacterium]
MNSFSAFIGLECSKTGEQFEPDGLMNLSPSGAPLLARYDIKAAAHTLDFKNVADRVHSMWRYHEMLPAPDESAIVTLGEGMTPLLRAPRLEKAFGLSNLFVKDEGLNPTGSFKSRGLSVAITMARHLGAKKIAIPTAGNAGGAAAAYASRAGIEASVFVPEKAPSVHKVECALAGADVTVVRGYIHHCAEIVAHRTPAEDWFELSTFKEPYRAEGKKTMAYELVEQFGGDVPDVILYPTGGGTGLVAMWRAFSELEALGWIGEKRPRMICVQAEGCAPLVRAYENDDEVSTLWDNPTTMVSGLRAPKVLADFLCLRAIRESGGTAIAVSDEMMFEAQRKVGDLEGILICPEGGACIAALGVLLERGDIGRDERIVTFNTATGLKYADMVETEVSVIDPLSA